MTLSPDNVLGTGDITIPSGINATTPEQKQMYRAALEFERFFVSHLMKQMDAGTKALAGEGGQAEAPGSGAYKDMVRDQMTQSVLDGGGLGLAAIIYRQVAGTAATPAAPEPPTGGDA